MPAAALPKTSTPTSGRSRPHHRIAFSHARPDRQGGEDVEDQPAAGGGGVQGLVQALEPDPSPAQRADDGDQVGQGPG